MLDVELYPVKGACDGLMSAWDMAEIAFNPFSVCGNAKFESPGAVIGDVGGVDVLANAFPLEPFAIDVIAVQRHDARIPLISGRTIRRPES